MKHPERIPDYLRHIFVACNRARAALEGMTHEQYLQSFVPQDVLIRQIEVIGEATKRIIAADPSFIETHPQLELAGAVSMRNRIAHQYEGMDLELI